ncbi:MAG: CoB--CoM heterodisulfide reductase subunit B [Euryarchaeota archaeon]|nr:CoB--CoM heterodisulfide reductase subunit B [Euryarchaeota archaeon]
MEFSLFLGCTVPNVYPGIEAATRLTMERLGVELLDMDGASCCPAPGAFGSVDRSLWYALGARNLTIAEALEADIMTVCSGCFGTLFEVNHRLKEDPAARERVNGVLAEVGREYRGEREVRHYVDVLYRDIGVDELARAATRPLEGLKVAVHYGCHLLKPSRGRSIDSPERPRMLEELIRATGAETVEYRDQLLCCGGGGGVRGNNPEEAIFIAARKLEEVRRADADLLVNPCSFCTLHYDFSQREMPGGSPEVPIMHYAQFLALAMDMRPEQVGLQYHSVSLAEVLEKVG